MARKYAIKNVPKLVKGNVFDFLDITINVLMITGKNRYYLRYEIKMSK